VSQDNSGQTQVAETLTQETKTFIRQVRAKTRRKYAPEDKSASFWKDSAGR
jgi:hypothetical protein